MVIAGGTGQLLHESYYFPLGTRARDSKGCSDEKCREIVSLFYFFCSHQPSLLLTSLPVSLSSVSPPLLSLSHVSHTKPELLQYSDKRVEKQGV